MLDDFVIFETRGEEDSKDELYLQDDGTFALVCSNRYNPPCACVLTAEEALEHFPEYADRIAAAIDVARRGK
jgi:hypothetical protein